MRRGARIQELLAMRKLLVPAAAAAFLASSALAFAATHNASGQVKSFDMHAGTLTLSNGTQYKLPTGFKDPGLKAGEKVNISWDMKNGSRTAEKVMIVK
jgi:Cu/Ag efflux protein CusF